MLFRHKSQPVYRVTEASNQTAPDGAAVRSAAFVDSGPSVTALGHDAAGRPLLLDIDKQPHIIIGGATGSGKSNIMQSIILSLTFKNLPSMARIIFIDPKIVEFQSYKSHPLNLYDGIVTTAGQTEKVLDDTLSEIQQRYKLLSRQGLRTWTGCRWYIFIDELADIIIERPAIYKTLLRIAQIGRAAGVHLIIATQQPSAKILPTALKANCPCRIACRTRTISDSRIILDRKGAETLQNPGDFIIDYADGTTARGHGDYYSDDDISRIIKSYTKIRIS